MYTQLILHLLTALPTPDLLPLAVLSHRIYSIILRILQTRLVTASELSSHTLLLECYHPSAKLTEPPYFCTYHGTDGLTHYDSLCNDDTNIAVRLGEMRNMYSRFRPHRRELENRGGRVRRPPGDVPGSRTYPGSAADKFGGETVKQILSLDGHELFTQLVAQTNLVKIGPRHGLFACFVGIEEGVVRVWRQWLKDMAAKGRAAVSNTSTKIAEHAGKGKEAIRDIVEEKKGLDDESILWVSQAKNTGLRFNVEERKLRRDAPILIRADDEDMPVSYEIEYDGTLPRSEFLVGCTNLHSQSSSSEHRICCSCLRNPSCRKPMSPEKQSYLVHSTRVSNFIANMNTKHSKAHNKQLKCAEIAVHLVRLSPRHEELFSPAQAPLANQIPLPHPTPPTKRSIFVNKLTSKKNVSAPRIELGTFRYSDDITARRDKPTTPSGELSSSKNCGLY
jgi:hypothetical protein